MEPLIHTDRTALHVQNDTLVDHFMTYYRNNADFLRPWEPKRDDDYFSRENFIARLKDAETNFREGWTVQLAAMDRGKNTLIGVCNYTGITYGPFQACFLGYSLNHGYQGRGYMSEILRASIDYMFREKGLHRIMANYMPVNERSGRLLERLGFEREGYAKEYLLINGRWEDHILTALINRN